MYTRGFNGFSFTGKLKKKTPEYRNCFFCDLKRWKNQHVAASSSMSNLKKSDSCAPVSSLLLSIRENGLKNLLYIKKNQLVVLMSSSKPALYNDGYDTLSLHTCNSEYWVKLFKKQVMLCERIYTMYCWWILPRDNVDRHLLLLKPLLMISNGLGKWSSDHSMHFMIDWSPSPRTSTLLSEILHSVFSASLTQQSFLF